MRKCLAKHATCIYESFFVKSRREKKEIFQREKIIYTMFLPSSTKQKFGLISRIFPDQIKEGRICFEALNDGSNSYLNNMMKKFFSDISF